MNKYAVAYLGFYENDLKMKVVEASTWYDALEAAFPQVAGYLENTTGLEEAKEEAFEQEWLFDVVEVK